jgi:RHS repeat-associated protein
MYTYLNVNNYFPVSKSYYESPYIAQLDYGNLEAFLNLYRKKTIEKHNINFNWKQELRDEKTDLIFLKSRIYEPEIKSFLTMDSYNVDNKYNYGDGDPINKMDPTGHMAKWVKDLIDVVTISAAVIATISSLGSASEASVGVVAATEAETEAATEATTEAATEATAQIDTKTTTNTNSNFANFLEAASGSTGIASDHTNGQIGLDLSIISFISGLASASINIGNTEIETEKEIITFGKIAKKTKNYLYNSYVEPIKNIASTGKDMAYQIVNNADYINHMKTFPTPGMSPYENIPF